MAEESKKQDQLLETTDCLEAIGTLKSAKNGFFLLSLLCMIVLQGCFWMVISGKVDTSPDQTRQGSVLNSLLTLAVEQGQGEIAVAEKAEQIEKAAAMLTADANAVSADANAIDEAPKTSLAEKIRIRPVHISQAVRLANFILIISAVMYSLSLLFGLKVSLVGRLGGVNHICKAFFISLFMLVFLLPWQLFFGGAVFGAIYTPAELLTKCADFASLSTAAKVLVLVRFAGWSLIALLLLIWAQLKSMRWAKNILRRLGIAG